MPGSLVRQHSRSDYADLKRLVVGRGLLEARDRYYALKTAVALLTVVAAVAATFFFRNPLFLIADAAFLGFAFTQIALLAHDVGHRQAFRGRRRNAFARLFFGNLLLGVSQSWWNQKHNQHHANPNHLEKDPDIQFPIIVFSADQVAQRSRYLRPLFIVQRFVFISLLPFQALNMRITTVGHLLKGRVDRPLPEIALLVCHVALYGGLLYTLGGWEIALAFGAVHHASFGFYNSSVFASNHKGMLVLRDDERMDFFREQVLTSRNVHGHPITDFWYGGLNYQIEHHLFPTMPRNRLGEAREIVRAFCEQRAVAYHETGLFESYREGFRHLKLAGRGLPQTEGAV